MQISEQCFLCLVEKYELKFSIVVVHVLGPWSGLSSPQAFGANLNDIKLIIVMALVIVLM